jgi:hypothetical protein
MSYGRMKQKEEGLQQLVHQILRRAKQIDGEEDQRFGADRSGEELPEELAPAESRLKNMREAKAFLERKARQKAASVKRDPDQAVPPDRTQSNFTDPDSGVQKTPDGFAFLSGHYCSEGGRPPAGPKAC